MDTAVGIIDVRADSKVCPRPLMEVYYRSVGKGPNRLVLPFLVVSPKRLVRSVVG